jgi:3-oxoacyl-[acyl-carrier protein] reductase
MTLPPGRFDYAPINDRPIIKWPDNARVAFWVAPKLEHAPEPDAVAVIHPQINDWRGALERKLLQTVRMMRLALPHMKGRTGAAIVNIASISGWTPQLAMSGQYGAAKAALIFNTERWALEFVPYGIRVNTVSPGAILVEGNGWDRYRTANPEYYADYVRHGFPMGRLGTAEEVANVIVFAASPRAHWINGRNIPVDGLEQPHAPLDRRLSSALSD